MKLFNRECLEGLQKQATSILVRAVGLQVKARCKSPKTVRGKISNSLLLMYLLHL